jgi:hypothetical protein
MLLVLRIYHQLSWSQTYCAQGGFGSVLLDLCLAKNILKAHNYTNSQVL